MIKADEEMLAIANVVNPPPLFERGSKRCSRIRLLPRLRVCAHFLKDTWNHQLISQSKLSGTTTLTQSFLVLQIDNYEACPNNK